MPYGYHPKDEEIAKLAYEFWEKNSRLPTDKEALPDHYVGWDAVRRALTARGLTVTKLVQKHYPNYEKQTRFICRPKLKKIAKLIKKFHDIERRMPTSHDGKKHLQDEHPSWALIIKHLHDKGYTPKSLLEKKEIILDLEKEKKEALDARILYREAFNLSAGNQKILPREDRLRLHLIEEYIISNEFPRLHNAFKSGQISDLWKVGIEADTPVKSLGEFYELSGLAVKKGRHLKRAETPPQPRGFGFLD